MAFGLVLAAAIGGSAAEKIAWKPLEDALLKIDDQPVKLWNLYQAQKKKNLVLIELGRRYLMLDVKAQEVFELDPASLERHKDELRGTVPEKSTLLPSDGWVDRDIGRAELIRFHLTRENRVFEVQLSHPLDLRMLY